MTTLIDREFPTYARGEVRDAILTAYRNSLRTQRDPVTGQPFDETTIRRATMKPSRFWTEAEAVDIVIQAIQKRGDFLAQNINPERSASPFLYDFHGTQRRTQPLPATGASGYVRARGSLGTEWQGSTELPDQTAIQATDEQGLTYQVLLTGEVDDVDEGVLLAMQGVSTGPETELQAGATLKWINPPPGSEPTCTVEVAFSGGTSRETDAEFAARLIDLRARPAGAGNDAHFRLWARQASNAVADAFVYPTALHSGSVAVAIVQKRGTSTGPLGRMPSVGTMTVVRGFLTPPVSGEVPGQVRSVVTPWQPEYSDVSLRLGMRRNTDAGWFDAIAWPHGDEEPAVVLGAPAPTGTGFRMQTQETATPTGVTPQLMWWNPDTSVFTRLQVSSVVAAGGPGQFDVTLSVGGDALPVGARISPYSGRHAELAKSIRDYFDSLGPGEVVDLANDIRGPIAFRRVEPSIRSSYYGGSAIQEYVKDALGSSLFRFALLEMTPSEPRVPVNVSEGPYLLVPRNVGVYDF
jgi:hypothetical protein